MDVRQQDRLAGDLQRAGCVLQSRNAVLCASKHPRAPGERIPALDLDSSCDVRGQIDEAAVGASPASGGVLYTRGRGGTSRRGGSKATRLLAVHLSSRSCGVGRAPRGGR